MKNLDKKNITNFSRLTIKPLFQTPHCRLRLGSFVLSKTFLLYLLKMLILYECDLQFSCLHFLSIYIISKIFEPVKNFANKMVGATRFEHATSWSQTKRSNQTELRPDRCPAIFEKVSRADLKKIIKTDFRCTPISNKNNSWNCLFIIK